MPVEDLCCSSMFDFINECLVALVLTICVCLTSSTDDALHAVIKVPEKVSRQKIKVSRFL